MVRWVEAGGDPEAFWRQTPRLLDLFFDGKAAAARELRRLAAWTAWHAGVLSKSKETPSLAKLLGEDAPPARRQTAAEQFAIAASWNTRLGGKVIYRDTV